MAKLNFFCKNFSILTGNQSTDSESVNIQTVLLCAVFCPSVFNEVVIRAGFKFLVSSLCFALSAVALGIYFCF